MTAASPASILWRMAAVKPRVAGWCVARARMLSRERMRLRWSTSSCLRARIFSRMSVIALLSREFTGGGDELVKLGARRAGRDRLTGTVDAVGHVFRYAGYVQGGAGVVCNDLARQPLAALDRDQ